MSKLISSAQRVVEHAGGRVKKWREVERSGRRKGREGGGKKWRKRRLKPPVEAAEEAIGRVTTPHRR